MSLYESTVINANNASMNIHRHRLRRALAVYLLPLLLSACDTSVLLCGQYLCVSYQADCTEPGCQEPRHCESAGSIRDRVPRLLIALRDAQRSCSADATLATDSDASRHENPGAPAELQWSDNLAAVATLHARDMAMHDFVSFSGSDGLNTETRLDAADLSVADFAESVAHGKETAAGTINSWLDNATDCRQLLDTRLSQVGAACATAPSNDRGPYWSLLLIAPAD